MKTKTLSFFGPYQQYVHQIKAENILNSNLTSDHMICYKQLCIGMTFQFLNRGENADLSTLMTTCGYTIQPIKKHYSSADANRCQKKCQEVPDL